MIDQARKTIEKYNLLNPYNKVVVGVSGGPDSVCLLDILGKLGYKVIIAHVNYELRIKDADLDEKFVKELGESKNIKVYSKKADLKNNKDNLEAVCRSIRYDFFNEVLKKEHAQKIAIAHTADDQVETFLMFMLRGASLRGLSAMDYQSGSIIRPLLDVSRFDVLEYLKDNNLSFRKDITNDDKTFTRNRIRHKLIPYLEKKFNPEIKKAILRNLALIRNDYEYIAQAANLSLEVLITKKSKSEIEMDLDQWTKIPVSLKRATLRRVINNLKGDLTDVANTHIDEIISVFMESEGKKYKKFWGLKFTKVRGKIVVSK